METGWQSPEEARAAIPRFARLTFRDVFQAGASHYGISDLEALVGADHKFESHYEHRMIGPYPERRDLYHARSPINFVDRLSCPIIFFQGLEDRVVPPNQAEMMVAALRSKKLPVAYLAFEGEQHGFRQAKNIKRALDAELYFYSRVFNFTPADVIEPVHIENFLEKRGKNDGAWANRCCEHLLFQRGTRANRTPLTLQVQA